MPPAAPHSATSAQIVYRTPPDPERRVYLAFRIHAVLTALADEGVAAEAALAGSGLDASQLTDASTRVSYRQLETVFRNALRLSKDPAIALRAGRRMHITAYGTYGYAGLCAPSVGDAIAFGVKYHRISGSVVDMAFSSDGKTVVYAYEPLIWSDPSQDLYRFAIEFALASHLTVTQDLLGKATKPMRVNVAYAPPAHARAYRALLRCRVHFLQPNNELAFDAALIARPMPLANPVAYASGSEMCERLLGELSADGSLASEIRSVLIMHPGRFPDAEAMAEQLAMHPRALRRRLNTEKTSYRHLLAEVRSRLAIEYLRRTKMTSDEIATRLGYSDAANFRRAFASWTGKNPSDFRLR